MLCAMRLKITCQAKLLFSIIFLIKSILYNDTDKIYRFEQISTTTHSRTTSVN